MTWYKGYMYIIEPSVGFWNIVIYKNGLLDHEAISTTHQGAVAKARRLINMKANV